MKYRVKFECYHYNTGSADNHTYTGFEDFDTIEEAQKFKDKLIEQREMEQAYGYSKISYVEYDKWKEKFDYYSVEDGYVSFYTFNEHPEIVKYFPEREELL